MYRGQNYEIMTSEKRPQDPDQNGEGWKFELSEHGGEYPDAMPQAIRATDAEGRSCVYLPVSVNGKVVDSKGFIFDSRPGSKLEFVAGHTAEEDFQHFLSYSGLRTESPEIVDKLRKAFEAGA
jgi:hypothetical protein